MSKYVTLTCTGCGQQRNVTARTARRVKTTFCQPCSSNGRAYFRDRPPPIVVTPEIEAWALIESAFFTEQDWRLIRELPPFTLEEAA